MKTQLTLILALLVTVASFAAPSEGPDKDTVTIEFGEKSKMVIIAETADDLKDLQAYDINKMIGELNAELDSAGGAMNVQMLSISDSSGNRYVKDSVVLETAVLGAPLVYYGEVGSNAPVAYPSSTYGETKKRSKYKGKRTTGAFELGLGMNNWLEDGSFPDDNNATYAVRPWGSWYTSFGVNSRTLIGGPFYINWGLDFSWYNWKMEDPNVRIIKGPDETMFAVDPFVKGSKSKLSATYINMSLVPMFQFGGKDRKRNHYGTFKKYGQKGFRIGAGGYIGYRVNSKTKFQYSLDGDSNQDKTKSNYYLNNFRYGVKGQVGFNGINIFVNYDMNTIFATGRGPKLQGISFGIIL